MDQVFTLSIEPVGSPVYVHPFHLGTNEGVARHEAEEMFRGRNAHGLHTVTVALIYAGHVFDVFDGKWSSDCYYDDGIDGAL